MLYLEKQIARTSLNTLNDHYNFTLIYQIYPLSTPEKEQIKIQIREVSPNSKWKLTTKFQEVQCKGSVIYIFNDSWDDSQKIYKRLQVNKNIHCIGAKFHGTWISTKEIDIILNTRPTFVVEKLMQTQIFVCNQSYYPIINLFHILSMMNLTTNE